MFFNALLAITLRTLLAWENKKLDRRYGTIAEQDSQDAAMASASTDEALKSGAQTQAHAGGENYGPRYRYVL